MPIPQPATATPTSLLIPIPTLTHATYEPGTGRDRPLHPGCACAGVRRPCLHWRDDLLDRQRPLLPSRAVLRQAYVASPVSAVVVPCCAVEQEGHRQPPVCVCCVLGLAALVLRPEKTSPPCDCSPVVHVHALALARLIHQYTHTRKHTYTTITRARIHSRMKLWMLRVPMQWGTRFLIIETRIQVPTTTKTMQQNRTLERQYKPTFKQKHEIKQK